MDHERALRELAAVLTLYDNAVVQAEQHDLSGLQQNEIQRLTTSALAAIQRIGGLRSVYVAEGARILTMKDPHCWHALKLRGVLESLRSDVEAGYLETVTELAHADVFSDFLEMARYLQTEGYKDAAAVIAGSSLEAHLRQLCHKWGVDVEVRGSKGVSPKKADLMNADLAKGGAYTNLDQKNVTAWLDLRNNAAHGKYDSYTREQVALLIDNVRDFMTRCPA